MHHYMFVRMDIPVADQMCQVIHAGVFVGQRFDIPRSCNLVLIGVKDKDALFEIWEICAREGIKTASHVEPDDGMGLCAIGTEIVPEEKRKLFREMSLWKVPELLRMADGSWGRRKLRPRQFSVALPIYQDKPDPYHINQMVPPV